MEASAEKSSRWAEAAFVLLALLSLTTLLPLPREIQAAAAPGALVAGAFLGLTLGNPFARPSKAAARWLLQASVVLLGFSMDFGQVLREGRSGLAMSLLSIGSVFGLGWLLRRALRVRSGVGLLVSAGTAICGGSAIAAVSTVVGAPEEDVSVAIGAVFVLNAVALLVFPMLGHWMRLSPAQFGAWAGIAIHDIASVAGAGAAYGPEALGVATAVKLSRVLYLVPITLGLAWWRGRRGGGARRAPIPWFVGLFLLASLGRTFVPAISAHADDVKRLAAAGFALSLFLIGAALTRRTLKSVGVRPLAMGALLWVFISVASLAAIRGMGQ